MAEAPHERRPRTPLPRDDDKPGRARGMLRGVGGRFWMLVLALLAINYLTVALFAPGREESVTIPYNPTFVQQVEQRNVARISATGESVSGEFREPIRYRGSEPMR